MKIFVVSGKAGSGKDTLAEILKDELLNANSETSVLITHYADLLKFICKSFFGWDGNKDHGGRRLLQIVGTDIVRKQNPDYWVDFIIQMLRFFEGTWEYVIIPDCRFPNELLRLAQEGFDVEHIRVERSDFTSQLSDEQRSHSSETSMDWIEPHYLIHNDGSLEDLRTAVIDKILK